MAVGDIVNDVFTTLLTYHYFQPAGTNEVMVTSAFGIDRLRVGLYDGVNISWTYGTAAGVATGGGMNVKIGINNAHYLLVFSDVVAPGFSGIQIK